MKSDRPIKYQEALQGQSSSKWKGKLNATKGYGRNIFEWLRWWMHLRIEGLPPLNYDKLKSNSIPVLLNNFNRLEPLKRMVTWLQTLDSPLSIIILDNNSSFAPLKDYYASLDNPCVQVIYLGYNSGKRGIEYYRNKLINFPKIVISDCDLTPYSNTPPNIIAHLSALLDRYPDYNHVGASLAINDLPDHYPLKPMVEKWEQQFWPPKATIFNNEAAVGKVDTTFAMWRNSGKFNTLRPALRALPPYTLRHVDWYIDPANLSEEYMYYIKESSSYASWTKEWKRKVEN